MGKCDSELNYNIEKFLELKETFSKYEIDKCKGGYYKKLSKVFFGGGEMHLVFSWIREE